MSFFDTLGRIGSNILGGVKTFASQAGKFSAAVNPITTAATAISNLFDNKDSGNSNPFGGGGSAVQSITAAPLISTTTETGAGPFGGGGSALQGYTGLNNTGSGGSLIPRPSPLNQNMAIETSQSSVGFPSLFQQAPNILGIGSQVVKRVAPFFGFGSTGTAVSDIGGTVGEVLDFEDDNRFNRPGVNMFEEFTQLVNPMTPRLQQQGAGFMSPVLGRIGVSSKGNIIITRKLRNQFKALADNVGLAQASNLAGVPLEIGAMILTKRFPMRSKSISTKKMRDCARTYKQITNFYNMIPKRTATRSTRKTSMRGASTVIQNS